MTLEDVLGLDRVLAAGPKVLTGTHESGRSVTWAHSSEIYEIAPLLSGGELLLTTGLGLAGADAGARRHWIRSVAAAGVSAVAVEPGRSFTTVPDELVDEAQSCGLPLIELCRVVPFIEICRAVNARLVDTEVGRLRRLDLILGELHASLETGRDAAALVKQAAELCGAPAVLATLSGRFVAVGGIDQGRQIFGGAGSRAKGGWKGVSPEQVVRRGARVPVQVGGRDWGHFYLGEPEEPDLDFLARRIARVLAIRLALGPGGSTVETVAASLLSDLLDHDTDEEPTLEQELVVRAGLAGFHPEPTEHVVGLAASSVDDAHAVAVLRRELAPRQHVIAPVRGLLLGLVGVADTTDAAGELARELQDSASAADATIVVGPASHLRDAWLSVQEAHAAIALTDPGGVTTTRQTTLRRVLTELSTGALERLVQHSVAKLVRWDRDHGTDLVTTLGVYLRQGRNATRTAQVLHLRRQSLHQRLTRIRDLIGDQVGDPEATEHLVVATAAQELLTRRGHTTHHQ